MPRSTVFPAAALDGAKTRAQRSNSQSRRMPGSWPNRVSAACGTCKANVKRAPCTKCRSRRGAFVFHASAWINDGERSAMRYLLMGCWDAELVDGQTEPLPGSRHRAE